MKWWATWKNDPISTTNVIRPRRTKLSPMNPNPNPYSRSVMGSSHAQLHFIKSRAEQYIHRASIVNKHALQPVPGCYSSYYQCITMRVMYTSRIILGESNWCHPIRFLGFVNNVASHWRILCFPSIVPLRISSVASDMRASYDCVYFTDRLAFNCQSLISLPRLSSSSIFCFPSLMYMVPLLPCISIGQGGLSGIFMILVSP